jgi:recombination protein RecA
MSQALRKLAGVISKTNAIAIFINQLREKVGVVYGNPRNHHRRQGAEVLRLVRIDVRKAKPSKNGSTSSAPHKIKS